MILTDLPPEVLAFILSYFKGFQLANVAQTCTLLRDLVYSEVLWQKRCKNEYGLNPVDKGEHTFRVIYGKVLHKYGPLLGLWQCKTSQYYGGLMHLWYDGNGGLVGEDYFGQRDIHKPLIRRSIFHITLNDEGQVVTEWTRSMQGPRPCSIHTNSQQVSAQDSRDIEEWNLSWNDCPEINFQTMIVKELERFNEDNNIQGTEHMLVHIKFREFLNSRHHQVFKRLRLPQPMRNPLVTIQPGLFKGTYGGHGTEIILLTFDLENHIATGLKVIGDSNVPAGEISIHVNLLQRMVLNSDQQATLDTLSSISTEDCLIPEAPGGTQEGGEGLRMQTTSRQPFVVPQGLIRDFDCPNYCIARYHAEGTVSPQFYSHPTKVKTHFIVFNENSFAVLWLSLYSLSVFSRVTEEFKEL